MDHLLCILKKMALRMAVNSLSQVSFGGQYQPKVDKELKSKLTEVKERKNRIK